LFLDTVLHFFQGPGIDLPTSGSQVAEIIDIHCYTEHFFVCLFVLVQGNET
jgi:hypothetical protein